MRVIKLLTLRHSFDFSDRAEVGLGLTGVDDQGVVDGDGGGLGELASGGLSGDLHHRLHHELLKSFPELNDFE